MRSAVRWAVLLGRRGGPLLAALLMAVMLGGPRLTPVSALAAPDVSVLDPFDCARAGFEQPTPSATCGWVTVPDDAGQPDNGRTVRLAVAIVRASGAQHAPDPIVFLQGGPGESAIEDTAALAQIALPRELAAHDLIVVDQRGTGLSQPNLSCPEMAVFARAGLDRPRSDAPYADQLFASLDACFARLADQQVDLATYTSAQNAADIVALGKALGYPQIDLYGLSYGTRLALTIIRDFGSSGYVRAAVLGGVYGPEANPLQVPVGLAERLERVFDACAADASCNAASGDLRRTFKDLLAQLSAAPVEVDVPDPHGGADLRARADGTVLLEALLDALGSSDGIAQIPARLVATSHGDPSLLSDGLKAQINELDSLAWGMNAAVQCQESFLLISPDEQAAVRAALPDGFEGLALRFPESSLQFPAYCAARGFAARPALERQAVSSSDVPVLAISGAFDPFTPPEWAERATAGFSTRYLVTLPAAGHDTALASECPIALAAEFIADPTQAPDTSCVAQPPAAPVPGR